MSKKVSIIDYGMSNLLSICRAFEHIGAEVRVIEHADDVLQSDYLVLPGVGAFPDGMKELEKRALIDPVKQFAESGKPLLGVCLGMQMLLGKSYEHTVTPGLNIIEGEVLALPKDMKGFKVPNINWHSADWNRQDNWGQSIFRDTKNGACFYFVHSYYAKPANEEHILATTRFGDLKFTSAVKKDNVTGTQFHPEKSGEEGLKLLLNFIQDPL
jgi:glutamine amidotransferase